MRLRRLLHGLLTVPLMSAAVLTVGLPPAWAAELPAVRLAQAPQLKPRVAVMDFRVIDVFPSLGPASAESLRSALIQLQRVTVIERGQIEQIVKEQHFNHTGLVGGDSAVALGKLLGASAIVVGSVTRFGDTYTINARSLDTRTGEALAAAQVSTRLENEIPALLQTVASTLFPATLTLAGPVTPVPAATAFAPPTVRPVPLAPTVTAVIPSPTPTTAAMLDRTGLSKSDALFKGLLVPSWGQFYAGEPIRATVTLALLAAGLVMISYTTTTFMPSNTTAGRTFSYTDRPLLGFGWSLGLLAWLGGAIDAFFVTQEFKPVSSATTTAGASHP
jgi:TolB-like protein